MSTGIVLIIDDEEKLRTLLARIIRLEGYTVLEAENLRQGGKLLEKEDVDVLLCDVKLPDGNGVDFVEGLKTRFPSLETILLTAYGNIADGVVDDKFAVVHVASASGDGYKGADDGYKVGDQHGFAAIFFIKYFGALDVFLAEYDAIFLAEQARPKAFANLVAYIVTSNCRQGNDDKHRGK